VFTRAPRALVLVFGVLVAGTAVACSSDERGGDVNATIQSSKAVGRTTGPNGERAAPASALRLTPRDVATVRADDYTAALVWHEDSDFTEAVTAGVRAEFAPLGIRVVAETSAAFDPAKQRADIETVA
jgi:ribose transport system substrate-binding protein